MKRIIILAGLVILVSLITSCGNDAIEKINKISSKDSLPDMTVKEVEVLYSDSAIVRMQLNAPEVKDFSQAQKPHTIFPKGLKVIFFSKESKPESSLKADYGYHDGKTDLWEYRGKVEIINQDGDTLRTDQLFANRLRDSIYSDKYVKIKKKDGSDINVNGGFNSNLTFTKRQFKNVSGKIKY